MKRNQTDLRDECPKCGANAYQGGYCFRCGTYRPSKHNERDEELDVAAFVERGFAQRVNYADDEALLDTDDLDNPNRRPRPQRTDGTSGRKPKKQDTHPRSQPEPAKPPAPRVKRSHLLQHPELSIPELIEMYNRGRGGHSVEQPRTDSAPPTCTPQSSAAVDPSVEPPPKLDSSIQITPEAPPPPVHVLETARKSESLSPFYPYDIAQQPAAIPVSSPKVPEIDSSKKQPTFPTKAPRRIFGPAFFISWILITVAAVGYGNSIGPSIITSAYLAFVASFVIDWIAGLLRR